MHLKQDIKGEGNTSCHIKDDSVLLVFRSHFFSVKIILTKDDDREFLILKSF